MIVLFCVSSNGNSPRPSLLSQGKSVAARLGVPRASCPDTASRCELSWHNGDVCLELRVAFSLRCVSKKKEREVDPPYDVKR